MALASLAVAALSGSAVARADCPPHGANGFYDDAHRAFEEKRYDESVELLRRAYACDPNPVYLGNIARTYEEASRPRDALAAWRAYLAVVTSERDRWTTEGRISALTKMIDDLDRLEREKRAAEEAQRKAQDQARAPAAPPPPEARPTPSDPPRRPVPVGAWIVTGAGAAGLATGLVLGLSASSKHSSATQATSVAEAESKQDDAQSLAHAANWAFAIGGGIAAIGLTWMAIEVFTSPASATPSARVGVGLIGPGLGVAGAFQ